MNVKIHSHFEGKTWEGTVDDELLQEGNRSETLFRLFNRVDEESDRRLQEWGYTLPSLSVGDRLEYRGEIWQVEPVGFELVSTSKLEEAQGKYDRLVAHRSRALRYFDECPDGDPRKPEALARLTEVGDKVRQAEDDLIKSAEWLERKQAGVRVARMLDALPVGTEFRLDGGHSVRAEILAGGYYAGGPVGVSRAYVATYRKNPEGSWDQVKGTCESPHVINMDPAHLGFIVGEDVIRAALES